MDVLALTGTEAQFWAPQLKDVEKPESSQWVATKKGRMLGLIILKDKLTNQHIKNLFITRVL